MKVLGEWRVYQYRGNLAARYIISKKCRAITASSGGEGGIRTHGGPSGPQRFSRPPRSTTPASLQQVSDYTLKVELLPFFSDHRYWQLWVLSHLVDQSPGFFRLTMEEDYPLYGAFG